MGNLCFVQEEPELGGEVILQIYDVSGNERIVKANNVLHKLGTGAFHAAVEVYGVEWSYGKTRGCGIFPCEPTRCQMHQYREPVHMGRTPLSLEEVHQVLHELAPMWPGEAYDLLTFNCTHFSDAFCQRLGVGPIPHWVTNLGTAGATIQQGMLMVKSAAMAPYIIAAAKANRIEAGIEQIMHAGKVRRNADPMDHYRLRDLAWGLALAGKDVRGTDPADRMHFRDLVYGAAAVARGHVPVTAGPQVMPYGPYGYCPGPHGPHGEMLAAF